MIPAPVAKSVARAVAQPVTGRVFAAPYVGSERVQNGNFDSATGWAGANWVIAASVATNTPAVGNLTNTLLTPLSGGEGFVFTFDVVANPANTGLIVSLVASGGSPAPQVIFNDGSTAGTKMSTGTVSGAYDQLRIGSVDDPGSIIDNVSFIA